ncbi:efflux RND transporter periplasmic adaptor subunit [Rubrivivax sp. RP6-9]|uniref:efflux RND transporter periplasmic adaptor subunit n=1 Tax=Rubrivivax sp. RP6-9 TaxID=3415750 RepID=UPI003CC6CC54
MVDRSSGKFLIPLILLVALVLALVAWAVWRAPLRAALQVQAAPLVRTLQFSARVATPSRVELGSTVTARVRRVLVDEGAVVQAGQVVLELEDDELRAALLQAQAGEQQAVARLAGQRSSGRSTVQAALAQADAVLLAAQAELQRTQDLVARGFLSPARLDEARRAADVAAAQRNSAQAQLAANAEQGSDTVQAQAQLATARAATQVAAARLSQAVLRAPAAGQVLLRAVEPGQIVQPGKLLLTLALTAPPELLAQVDERELEQLRAGQVASVVADAYPGRRFAARVLRIAPLVDAQRGAVEVTLAPQPPVPEFLREDMTLSVEVETARRDRALVLPLSALRSGDTVLVLQDGRAVARPLRLGLRTLQAVEVLDGLAAGDVVLVDAAATDGSRARPDFATAAAAAATTPAGARSRDDAGGAMGSAMGR